MSVVYCTVECVGRISPQPARRSPIDSATMTNIWSLPGAASGLLLVISTCAYVKVSAARNQSPCLTHDACRAPVQRVPRLRSMILSEKRGAWGALYKAAVIGTRLHWQVSMACALMALCILFKSG